MFIYCINIKLVEKKIYMKKKIYILGVLILVVACGKKGGRDVDLNGISFDVNIERFDNDFYALSKGTDVSDQLLKLFDDYPQFAPLYFDRVVYFGDNKDTISTILPKFFADTVAMRLYEDALRQYDDMSAYNKQLTDAFRRMHYFLPEVVVPPRVVSCVSLLNQSIVVADSLVAVGIDKYLGKDYDLYHINPNNYDYVLQNWTPEKMVPDIISSWILTEFPYESNKEQLIDEMIYRGKILYITALLLPNDVKANIIGYTPQQWQWCEKNENAMWRTLIAEQHLFDNNHLLKLKYINDAPFTQPFTQESPGRGGQYIGWQIVEAYMSKNRNITPKQLLYNNDSQKILEQSGYNP